MAATVIAAIVTVFAIVTISKFLLSTEVEERDDGCFHRRVLRAVPVQALNIIVVVADFDSGFRSPGCSCWNTDACNKVAAMI